MMHSGKILKALETVDRECNERNVRKQEEKRRQNGNHGRPPPMTGTD